MEALRGLISDQLTKYLLFILFGLITVIVLVMMVWPMISKIGT